MKREVTRIAEAALTGVTPMLVLRGDDAQARDLGDLDFLVPKHGAVQACRAVAIAARERGWYLISFRDIGYLASVVLARPSGLSVESVKLDFFDGLDWYGAGCEELSNRFFRGILPAATSEGARRRLAGAVNFLQKCMTSGRLSERDLARVRGAGASPNAVLDVARALGLPMSPEEATTGRLTRSAKWRLRAASCGADRPWASSRWLARAAFAHVAFKVGLRMQSGLVFAVGGLDGSGKSTQHELLVKAYKAAGMTPVRQVHLLPRWIPLPHQILRRTVTSQNYTRPYSEAPVTSRVSAAMRLGYYLVAFLVAKAALWWAMLRGDVVVMDRSFMDFAADLARARIPHRALPRVMMRACAPVGRLAFIDVTPGTVVTRKGELTLEKASELRERYHVVVRALQAVVIDGEGPPDAVFREILNHVDGWYRPKLVRLAGL